MLHFASMADDGRVKLWNLGEAGSEKPLWKCRGHTDQVRDGKVGERSDNLLVTGGKIKKLTGVFRITEMGVKLPMITR